MITDEDLLLYYYRDGLETVDRARIGAALGEQPELARRLHRLIARLDAAASAPDVPVPAHIEKRWRFALERAAGGNAASPTASPRHSFFGNLRWQVAAAVVAVVALVFTIELAMDSPDRATREAARSPTETAAGTQNNLAFVRGLKWHLASTERELTTLENATPDERARLIGTIVAQNRLYALAADRAGEPQLARVLRAFAPVLENVARDGNEPPSSSLAQLNFELRVIQARLNAEARNPPGAQADAL
jgi:hypothetical protein